MRTLRVMLACALLVLTTAMASAAEPQLIFLVRHAEKAASAAVPGATPPTGAAMTAAPDDPPLSAPGQERASRLAAMLRSANIRNIMSTEFLRTRQTAAPLAQALHLEVVTVAAEDPEALLAQVRQRKGNTLIVGHSNSVPELLKRLGIKETITIPDAEYDNLFIVVRADVGEPTLIRLRY